MAKILGLIILDTIRMEVISEEPFMLLDACINAASCGNVKDVLNQLNIKNPTVIIGVPDDKDYVCCMIE